MDGTDGCGRRRLRELDEELALYKQQVEECKKENELLRLDIENAQKDSAEYTAYLLLKKAEKQSIIDKMNTEHLRIMTEFDTRKSEVENQLKKQAEGLENEIAVLDEKLDAKNQEILSLADVLHIRQRHEAQLAASRAELDAVTAAHQRALLDLERKLLEERVHVARRNDAQVAAMQTAAQHQALAALSDHTSKLAHDSEVMARELRDTVAATKALLARRDALALQYATLAKARDVRERTAAARLAKVAAAARAARQVGEDLESGSEDGTESSGGGGDGEDGDESSEDERAESVRSMLQTSRPTMTSPALPPAPTSPRARPPPIDTRMAILPPPPLRSHPPSAAKAAGLAKLATALPAASPTLVSAHGQAVAGLVLSRPPSRTEPMTLSLHHDDPGPSMPRNTIFSARPSSPDVRKPAVPRPSSRATSSSKPGADPTRIGGRPGGLPPLTVDDATLLEQVRAKQTALHGTG
ncbi:hypothetical protein, variant [Allomyces macrogynus ATCC 38327]|uniref:Uncharacterized protein n=1 Tax=Allomyces macrogynus (strain ATCC 38327) TaxID=578462 RepID=A0A0L0SUB3_ALLM3|nr:hypothetical protein, variant [Allomyces macrogynus ATCC 38327]|eukprot:KNE65929.1 hypothetical protein, variant [Allomyces macrogynus ATCC 38327]